MKEFDIFLRALEERLGFKKGVFIYKKCTIPNSKFPAYKDISFEVWHVEGSYNTLISIVQTTKKETTDEEIKESENYLLMNTYKNMLKFYGI